MIHIRGHHDLSLLHAFFTVRMLGNKTIPELVPAVCVAALIVVAGSLQAPLLSDLGRLRLSISVSFGTLFLVGTAIAFPSSNRLAAAGKGTKLQKRHR